MMASALVSAPGARLAEGMDVGMDAAINKRA